MTTANARTLEQANAAIAVGDYEGFLAHCTDHTMWHFVGERTLRGKEAVRRYLTRRTSSRRGSRLCSSSPRETSSRRSATSP